MTKIIRTTTVPTSLKSFCSGIFEHLTQEGFECMAISSPNTKSGSEGQGMSELEEYGRAEGIHTIAVPMERHISLVSDLKSLWRMYRVLRRERPDLVHSMTPKAGLMTMVAGWLAGVPRRVHTFTGLVWPTSTGLKRRVLMATDWITCACATHIIPEGEGVKSDLLNHHITRKPLKVLGYGNVKGIDMSIFDPAAIEVPAHEGFTFVFVGRIVRDKGINELVAAFDRLHREHADCRLVLVGPSEDNLDPVSPATRSRIEQGDGIEAVGGQHEVRPFYAAADALVFPSYREGFPNVVIEAGAMGLPSIVTDINGSREIIIEGENGVIIPSKDEEALYLAMKRFVEHPDDVAAMAANARPLIASRFEQGYVRQCLYDFYHEILNC
ncbi:MAG: glycosyltransferase family 4 protein [Muribaculaceae bacterium]|nr:glycosyltransferase family 4 protein [Muribaculaceae bacterium]